MTEEEKALPLLTRKNLMTLPNWNEWQAADDKQLDSHFEGSTIGMAVPRPVSSPEKPSQVFRLVWARLVRQTDKSRLLSVHESSRGMASLGIPLLFSDSS